MTLDIEVLSPYAKKTRASTLGASMYNYGTVTHTLFAWLSVMHLKCPLQFP